MIYPEDMTPEEIQEFEQELNELLDQQPEFDDPMTLELERDC